MRKAILPLLIIITMVLSASVAYADDLTDTGTVNAWTTTSGAFASNGLGDGVGVTTNTSATATHPVAVGSDGQFGYQVGVQLNDLRNGAMIGVVTDTGAHYTLELKGGNMYLNGSFLHAVDFDYTSGTIITLGPSDGANINYDIGGSNGAFPADGIPTSIEISLTNDVGGDAGPVIYAITFTAPGHPSIKEMPATASAGYDLQQVQNYYANIYPVLFGPQANFLSNSTAQTSFKVSGIVTGAADNSPIAGASVVLGNAKQTTDSLGAFKFDGITAGNVDIAVSADGFASTTQSINVNADQNLKIALDKAGTGGSTVASAANETTNVTTTNTTVTNTTMTNVTVTPTMAPTTVPSATQTKSPGFEGIVAAIAMIGAAGALVYMYRKR